MKQIKIDVEKSSRLAREVFLAGMRELLPEVERVREAIHAGGYGTDYASVNLPTDPLMLEKVQMIVDAKKALNPRVLVVIGIGGSHLGAAAVQQAVFGSFYNAQQPDLKIYYVDSVDADYTHDIYLLIEKELQAGHAVILNMISKSGSTIETRANFQLFLDLIKRYKKEEYPEAVVITTDHGSTAWQYAQREEMVCLEIPALAGGRYSVFSPVGLFPLGLLGVDILALRAGARDATAACVSRDVFDNPAALRALCLREQYAAGCSVHDTFVSSVDLEGVARWYRQLMAESVGKQFDRSGGLVKIGMLPTVSVATADLHSVAQLYLAGPQNRITSFLSVEKNKAELAVPENNLHTGSDLAGLAYARLMRATMQGVQRSYEMQKLPFMTISLPEKTAYYVGQLLQINMFEIIYLGFLFDINPFDQPEVELYKRETRKILRYE